MNNIKIKKTDFWAKITFSKPPLNIFNAEDLIYLEKILQELKNQEKLKLIIFDSDQKVFSAGVDVADHLPEKAPEMLKAFHKLFIAMIDLEIPTLAMVKSACLGGGSEFALFCDFVLASENVCFAQPEIKLACFPPLSMAHLAYLTGNKKALELILTGEKISAKDALRAGLVNHVFSEEEFDDKAEEFINSITQNSSSIIRTTLKTYKKINYADLKEKIELSEKIFLEELIKLEDYPEGTNSFLEKRLPVWKNC
jgi:cyclohexa-1,5-dienecarbonyl-CoA hydratase